MHGYRKMICFGDILEIYEYEKTLSNFKGKSSSRRRSSFAGAMLASDRADSIQPDFKKRQDNARRARVVFQRLVASNLTDSEHPLLITLTYSENITSIEQGYADFRSFIQSMRYKFGKRFSYIAVPEFQKRGAVHFHSLFWGLPSRVFNEQRQTRLVDSIWGLGFVFMKRTDGNIRLSRYLSKYMSKSYLDSRLCRQKAYTASRNIKRPLCQQLPFLYDVLGDYGLSTVPPLQVREYRTQWLGACRKLTYQIKNKK